MFAAAEASALTTSPDALRAGAAASSAIVDICCDLGIAPGHLDRAFWDEINHAIRMYGGSLARFLDDLHERLFVPSSPADGSDHAEPGWPAAPPRLAAPATGPP